jgi:putative lipoic acid-binding regulatory protein
MLSAATSMIHYTKDGLAKSNYTILSFTNKSMDKAVSGVISQKGTFDGVSINLRATDLTKTQIAAIFKILGAAPPPL